MEDKQGSPQESKRKKSACERFRGWIGSPSFYIYANFFLGSWGDRMWSFAVGLFLVVLSDGLLRLAAIYGLCNGISVLLFGGLIGDWVDKNRRLKVVRLTLFIQNFSVMLSAIAVCLTLLYEDMVNTYWNGGLKMLSEASIIALAVIAQLASVGYKIAIQKDWIVVVSGGSKSTLANLNAVIRATDLSCKVLAPTATGFIMSYASLLISAVVIAAWNLLSVFVEYSLLLKVYSLVPELAAKQKRNSREFKRQTSGKEPLKADDQDDEPLKSGHHNKDGVSENKDTEKAQLALDLDTADKDIELPPKKKKTIVQKMFNPCITFGRSWRTYAKQKVVFAGLSLAFLFMTVLGFDSITVGFIYANGVTPLLAGISMALAGVTGIIGTFCFTKSRKKIGLERTGLFAYTFDITCLCLCVASVFAPGSPFDPSYHPDKIICAEPYSPTTISPIPQNHSLQNVNLTHGIGKRDLFDVSTIYKFAAMDIGSPSFEPSIASGFNLFESKYGESRDSKSMNNSVEHYLLHVISKREAFDTHQNDNNSISQRNGTNENCHHKWKQDGITISVILLLVGIVVSRIGLWMADLVVTQLLQENVPEQERGAVGGVQSSLNMLMDLLKFVVVIFVPHIEWFGFLIIMSFCFVCSAGCFFAFHSYRVRGHLFHCRQFWCFCCERAGKQSLTNGEVKQKPSEKSPDEENKGRSVENMSMGDNNMI